MEILKRFFELDNRKYYSQEKLKIVPENGLVWLPLTHHTNSNLKLGLHQKCIRKKNQFLSGICNIPFTQLDIFLCIGENTYRQVNSKKTATSSFVMPMIKTASTKLRKTEKATNMISETTIVTSI